MRSAGSRSCSTTCPNAHLAGVQLVGGRERLDEADGLDLARGACEHRVRDRLQQALAHLRSADPRQRVQACLTPGLEAEDHAVEGGDEGAVLALGVDDLAAAAEHARAVQPALGERALAVVGHPEHERVRDRQDAAAGRAPTGQTRTIRRADPSRYTPRASPSRPPRPRDRRPGSERSRRWCPARSAGRAQTPQPSRRALGSLASQRFAAGSLLKRAELAHRGVARGAQSGRSLEPPAEREAVGERLCLLAPHPLQPQRGALGLQVDPWRRRPQVRERVGHTVGDADGDVCRVADGGVSFGELSLAPARPPGRAGAGAGWCAARPCARRLCSVAVSVAARSAWRIALLGPTSSMHIAIVRVVCESINSGCRNSARTSIRGHSARPQRAMQAPHPPQVCPVLDPRHAGRRCAPRCPSSSGCVAVELALAPAAPRVIAVADRRREPARGSGSRSR